MMPGPVGADELQVELHEVGLDGRVGLVDQHVQAFVLQRVQVRKDRIRRGIGRRDHHDAGELARRLRQLAVLPAAAARC